MKVMTLCVLAVLAVLVAGCGSTTKDHEPGKWDQDKWGEATWGGDDTTKSDGGAK
jgi:hypothetical protein